MCPTREDRKGGLCEALVVHDHRERPGGPGGKRSDSAQGGLFS